MENERYRILNVNGETVAERMPLEIAMILTEMLVQKKPGGCDVWTITPHYDNGGDLSSLLSALMAAPDESGEADDTAIKEDLSGICPYPRYNGPISSDDCGNVGGTREQS